ncbi:MAG: bacillithiol biosynthesis deacetylase BshB1 [Candidatus Omnitrophica bacterium]|nr:bacillithiol biosynthesis deacetylase BshB1 [Candidatus Omnitrophota bacterium]
MNDKNLLDVLIFAPHPDDAEIGMGGTILKLVASGKRVGVIDLCRGELGTKGDAEIRAREVEAASRLLGLHYRGNLDLGDGRIMDTHENRLKAAEAIRRFRSPHVFTCTPQDPHPDHRAAGEMVQAAYFLARLPKVETESPAFSAKHCFYYFLHEMQHITFAVDITDQFEIKMDVLRAFRSQFVDPDLPPDYKYVGTSDYLRQIEAYNRTIGGRIGAVYAEGYASDRPIPLSLPTIIE